MTDLLRFEVRLQYVLAPHKVDLATVTGARNLDRECFRAFSYGLPSERRSAEIHGGIARRSPLPRLFVDDELPVLVVDALREKAVRAFGYVKLIENQVPGRFEDGCLIGPEPPNGTYWRLGEHVSTTQTRTSVVNGEFYASGGSFRLAAWYLRETRRGERDDDCHSQSDTGSHSSSFSSPKMMKIKLKYSRYVSLPQIWARIPAFERRLANRIAATACFGAHHDLSARLANRIAATGCSGARHDLEAALILSPTNPRWLEVALADFDRVLVDHAHCEKKAAASAMSLVAAYPDRERLVRRLSSLAIEELRHFRAVHLRLRRRGLTLGRDPGDPYALDDPELAAFYRSLAEAEARHADLFGELARHYDDQREAEARLATLVAAEGKILKRLPIEPRMH